MKLQITGVSLCLITLCMPISHGATEEEEEFDYIVVGAGSAGCVLANRLSAKYSVLLLEKGGQPNILTEIPALTGLMYFTENADKYVAEKQPEFGLGLDDQRVGWTRGTGIGGSSLMNFLIYVRGHREDYDRWAADGNPGWSYDEVLASFRQIESAQIPHRNASLRGDDGELGIAELPHRNRIVSAYVEACKQYGLKHLPDYNDGNLAGVGYLQANMRNGRRCHSGKAFLHDAIRDRKTLTVRTGALVTRLIIDGRTKTTEGVQYSTRHGVHRAKAKREVILAAGSYGSPQILMLSGIGPRKHLEEMDIKVVRDLPVGEILYDHVCFSGVLFTANVSVGPTIYDAISPVSWQEFLRRGRGPLTVPSLVLEAVAFVKTDASNESLSLPDVELIFASGTYQLDNGLLLRKEYRFSKESYDAVWRPLEGENVWMLLTVLFHPRSRGYMRLRSTDAADMPRLYANYFTDPENGDMRTLIAGVRAAQRIAKMPPLARYGSEASLRAVPGCRREVVDSDGYWECQIRHLATSIWHQVATCKMGPESDPEAVVDSKLRVHGVKKLRVADSSVIPRPMSVHTNAPVTLIGQRAAELILEEADAK